MTSHKQSRKMDRVGRRRNGLIHFRTDILQLKLDAAVVDYLVSRLVLTIEDADKIRSITGQTDCNKRLLSILEDRPYNPFRIFTEALNIADPMNNELVNSMQSLETDDVQPNIRSADKSIKIEDFSVRFHKTYKTLVDEIGSPINITDNLLEQEIFSREDYEDISSSTTVFQKNRKLLSKLASKGKIGYESFLRALQTSDDFRDQELAREMENTDISTEDKILLQIGITLSHKNENIPKHVRELSKQIEDGWIKDDATFVETKGTMKVLSTIHENDSVTIVGSSGAGKTALMRHVVLKLKFEKGFQIIHIDSPKESLKYRNVDTKQIFLIDDVFGTYAVNQILVGKWERLDNKIRHSLKMSPGNMKLLFTSRKQVVNDEIFTNCSSIITQNLVDLEDEELSLSKEEKKKIITKHLDINNFEGSITAEDIEEACKSNYAFPLLCRIVSANKERQRNICQFFRQPFYVIEEELRKLWIENKVVYCSLVFCMMSNGTIAKDFFDMNLPKPEIFDIIAEACCLDTNMSRQLVKDGLKSVEGTYLSYENGGFSFMHDAFKESISCNFAKRKPDVMFSHCKIDLIRDRVRINSKLPNDDENVIVITRQDQYEVVTRRLLTECEEGRFSSLLFSQLFKCDEFVEYLVRHLNTHQTNVNILIGKVSKERQNNTLKELLFEMWHNTKITDNNILDMNDSGLKRVINSPSRHSTFLHWIVACGSYTLFRYFWENTSMKIKKKLLSRDWKYPITKPFFPLAVLGGNIDIIRELHSSGADINCFSSEGETPLSITCMSGRSDIANVLIELGADVNQPDMFSHRFPSFICVENENVEVFKVLLNNNCDVNLVDIYDRSSTMLHALVTRKRNIVYELLEFDSEDHPLHAAILNGDVDRLQTNLVNGDINSKTKIGLTPLHYATQVNDIVMIRLLLEHGAKQETEQIVITDRRDSRCSKVTNVNSKNKNGLTPLHLAVLNDHVDAVKLLVEGNADINAKDQFGRIPLHYSQIVAISSLLLNRQTSTSIVPNLPMSDSSEVQVTDVVIVGVDGDGEIHQPTLPWRTIFKNCAWYILPFKRKIDGEPINQPDHQGNTPLHMVVETARCLPSILIQDYGVEDNIQLLLKNGANIHLRNDEGNLPSDLVAEQKDLQASFAPYTSKKSGLRQTAIEYILLAFALIICFAILISPLVWRLSKINQECNFDNDSNSLNKTDNHGCEARVNGVLRYHVFLTGIMLDILSVVVIIRVVISLRKQNCRYRATCFIVVPMIQFGLIALLILNTAGLRKATFNLFWYTFLTWLISFYYVLAISVKSLISLEFKRLQTLFIIHIIAALLLPVIITLCAVLEQSFVTPHTSLSNIFQNKSFILQENEALNRTTLLNSIDNSLGVQTQDLTTFYYSLMYIISITFCAYVVSTVCEKIRIPLSKRKIRINKFTDHYFKNLVVVQSFMILFALCMVMMYYVKNEEFERHFFVVELIGKLLTSLFNVNMICILDIG